MPSKKGQKYTTRRVKQTVQEIQGLLDNPLLPESRREELEIALDLEKKRLKRKEKRVRLGINGRDIRAPAEWHEPEPIHPPRYEQSQEEFEAVEQKRRDYAAGQLVQRQEAVKAVKEFEKLASLSYPAGPEPVEFQPGQIVNLVSHVRDVSGEHIVTAFVTIVAIQGDQVTIIDRTGYTSTTSSKNLKA